MFATTAQESFEPATIEALYAAGHMLHSRECWADAAAVFRLMLKAVPTDERAWLALGDCHERAGQPLIALELYGAATLAAAPAPRCAIAKVRLLRALDRDDEADSAWEALVAEAEASGDEETAALIEEEGRVLS